MIEIIHARENEDDFTVYFVIDIDDENYEFHADIPKDKNQQEWLEDNQDYIRFFILQKTYRGTDWQRFQKNDTTRLQAIIEWIKAGHKNQILVGYKDEEQTKPIYEYCIIEKLPWRSTHPPRLAIAKDIDTLDVKEDLKDILKKIITT